jgi:hypothetical protein
LWPLRMWYRFWEALVELGVATNNREARVKKGNSYKPH